MSDIVSPKKDEGFANFYTQLRAHLTTQDGISLEAGGYQGLAGQLDRVLLHPATVRKIHQANVDCFIYLPAASVTLGAMVRASTLKLIGRKPVILISLQPRELIEGKLNILGPLLPRMVVVQSQARARRYRQAGVHAYFCPSGVSEGFLASPQSDSQSRARKELGLDGAKKWVLHVGPLTERRRLDVLVDLVRGGNWAAIVVGSVSARAEESVVEMLRKGGVHLIHERLDDIRKVYDAADAYLFPCLDEQGAVEFPLSVVEALARGLPVVTTRFGGLANILQENPGLRFFMPDDNVEDLLDSVLPHKGVNRSLVSRLTWHAIFEKMLAWIEGEVSYAQ